MAEYLIQDTTLDAIADAINAKTGGSSAMTPAEMATEIAAIPTGGGGNALEVTDIGLSIFSGYSDARNIIANFTGTGRLSRVVSCDASVPFKKITINAINGAYSALSFRHAQDSKTLLEEIEINGLALTAIHQVFQEVHSSGNTSLKSIHTLDLSRCGGANYALGNGFGNQNKLETLLIVPNTMGKLPFSTYSGNVLNLQPCSLLTDDSLVSIANGCNATNTSTIQFHSTPRARLSAIIGSVSTHTDDDGNYDFFTADENGTVTLLDFITNTKGWTVA